ncbi:MAG: hypothetical protein QOD12_2945 [Verrucomicrobiota bacterium]
MLKKRPMISSLLYRLNHAPLWRREIRVWDRPMRAASLDRLVCLALHRSGFMGSREAALLPALVRPGMQVIDVGANLGLYSLLLSGLVGNTGSVLAFEPEPNLFAILRENCARNGATNVRVFPYALGRASGHASLQRSAFNSGDNRLGYASPTHEAVEVQVEKFDDLHPDSRPDFVKIDVQGHELGALLGMEQALMRGPIVRVLFEFAPAALRRAQTEPRELLQFFAERGFHLYETHQSGFEKMNDPESLLGRLRGNRYTNLVASRDSVVADASGGESASA